MRDVYFNGKFLTQRMTGVHRVAHELLLALDEVLGENPELLTRFAFKIIAPQQTELTKQLQHIRCVPSRMLRPGLLWSNLWEQIWLPILVRGKLLISLCNMAPLVKKQQIVMVHDLIPIEHPQWFSRSFAAWYRFAIPKVIQRAQKILTNSQFSKRRILHQLNISSEKIEVMPLGISKRVFSAQVHSGRKLENGMILPEKYFVFVGDLQERKNIVGLLAAWRLAFQPYDQVHLLVVGSADAERFKRCWGESELPAQVQLTGYVHDQDLVKILTHALALVYPSFYEGFGFPPLEAMACKTPAIVSNVTSLPEILGDAVYYVDPYEPRSIAQALKLFAQDAELRQSYMDRALAHVGQYTWRRSAHTLLKAIVATYEQPSAR